MLVTVHVRNIKPVSLKLADLGFNFLLNLLRRNPVARRGSGKVLQTAAKSLRAIGQCCAIAGKRLAINQHNVTARLKGGLRSGNLHSSLEGAGVRHDGGRCENALCICQSDGAVHS